MTLADTGKEVLDNRPSSSASDRNSPIVASARRPSATVYASELRLLLPPGERWMVAAFGE
jgi:hypothetical protein